MFWENLTYKILFDETKLLFRTQMMISVFDVPVIEKIYINGILGTQGNN